jgi:predicted kinase
MDLIIMIGLQASGKSSFCRRFAETHLIISKDLFPSARHPQRRQMRELEAALASGRSVVVDNTNPEVEDRKLLIEAAKAVCADVIGYYLESKVEESLQRNSLRPEKKRVPDVAIFSTIKRLARPSRQEGFDRLYHVRMAPDDAFLVENWLHEDDLRTP